MEIKDLARKLGKSARKKLMTIHKKGGFKFRGIQRIVVKS